VAACNSHSGTTILCAPLAPSDKSLPFSALADVARRVSSVDGVRGDRMIIAAVLSDPASGHKFESERSRTCDQGYRAC